VGGGEDPNLRAEEEALLVGGVESPPTLIRWVPNPKSPARGLGACSVASPTFTRSVPDALRLAGIFSACMQGPMCPRIQNLVLQPTL
jgi:hypothetical protein